MNRTGKRGAHEGSIFHRSDGLWVGAIDLGRVKGRRKRRVYYNKSRRAVAEWMKAALKAQQDGLPLVAGRQSLASYLEEWLIAARPALRPRTALRYEQYLRLHATPFIGHIALSKLAPQHLRTLYAERTGAGLSPASVGHLHAVLHTALRQAERDGLIARNVVALVSPPRVPRQEMRALSPEQASILLQSVQGDRLAALYELALATGARQGELLALRWSDVDLDAGVVTIQRSLVRSSVGLSFAEPKTSSSLRSVPIGRYTVEALRDHRRRQAEERIRAGTTWEDQGLIFTNTYGRPVDAGELLRSHHYRLLDRAGVPRVRFHDLRHTAATLMLAQGVHPKVVSERLGHSTPMLTLTVYSHVTPTMQREAATALDALLHQPILATNVATVASRGFVPAAPTSRLS